MTSIWKLFCLPITIGICLSSHAQSLTNYRHYTFWSRITVAKVLQKKWELSAEYQHRRQNYWQNDLNLFDAHLLNSFRLRARYTINDQISVSLIPFTYFYASPLLGNEKNYQRKPDKEIRFALQAELRQKLGTIELFNRYGYENRWIKRADETSFKPIGRFRFRLLLEKPIINQQTKQERFRPYASTEILLNAGRDVTLAQLFEHFRVSTGIRWSLHPHMRLDTGYQYARRLRRNSLEGDHEHTLITNIIVTL